MKTVPILAITNALALALAIFVYVKQGETQTASRRSNGARSDSAEIAQLEQSLIDEGMAPEEIQKFCNVHVLLFESSLAQPAPAQAAGGEVPALRLFRQENREIEKRVAALRQSAADPGLQPALPKLLAELTGVETHYARKEQVLFPYLEKHGFVGPSKVSGFWHQPSSCGSLSRPSGWSSGGVSLLVLNLWKGWSRMRGHYRRI